MKNLVVTLFHTRWRFIFLFKRTRLELVFPAFLTVKLLYVSGYGPLLVRILLIFDRFFPFTAHFFDAIGTYFKSKNFLKCFFKIYFYWECARHDPRAAKTFTSRWESTIRPMKAKVHIVNIITF